MYWGVEHIVKTKTAERMVSLCTTEHEKRHNSITEIIKHQTKLSCAETFFRHSHEFAFGIE